MMLIAAFRVMKIDIRAIGRTKEVIWWIMSCAHGKEIDSNTLAATQWQDLTFM